MEAQRRWQMKSPIQRPGILVDDRGRRARRPEREKAGAREGRSKRRPEQEKAAAKEGRSKRRPQQKKGQKKGSKSEENAAFTSEVRSPLRSRDGCWGGVCVALSERRETLQKMAWLAF